MSESLKTRFFRYFTHVLPCYRGTGAKVTYISSDWLELRVAIPLSLRTRNYVGTIFGGSLYGGVDPWYMIMLIHVLGKGFTVWDKAATIRFRKPGREKLHAIFQLSEMEITEIKSLLERQAKIDRTYKIEIVNTKGEIHAEIEKVIHIKKN